MDAVTDQDVAADRIPVVLRLLDHQIVGADGELLGNVDDLVLRESAEGLVVTGLLSGPAALAWRQGGRGGHWLYAMWRRLHPDQDPRPLAIPLDHVTRLDSAVHVSALAERALSQTEGVELWLREHVISRIPGALGGAEDDDRPIAEKRHRFEEFLLRHEDRTLSRLLGAAATTADGRSLGEVVELTADAQRRSGLELGPLTVREFVCSPRHMGQELGYTMAPQGPALLRVLVGAWHRSDVRVDASEVHVDWDGPSMTLAASTPSGHRSR